MVALSKPAAEQARARQRCRHSIALVPFWTGPIPEGRFILLFPPRPESSPKHWEIIRFSSHAPPLHLPILCRRRGGLQYSNPSPPNIRLRAARSFGRIGESPKIRDG